MTSTDAPHTIEPGQECLACDPRDHIRIRIISRPVPGAFGDGKVQIASITATGREIRPRMIAVRQLHNNPSRKTGYRLVRHADGSAV